MLSKAGYLLSSADQVRFFLQMKRKTSSSYMARQSDITSKMRAILVDWLVDVHYKYGLLPQTLHIAVLLIDQYLEKNLSVKRQRLQLVGVAAMFIASKYEEIYPPEAEDFVKITDNAYSRRSFPDGGQDAGHDRLPGHVSDGFPVHEAIPQGLSYV